MSKLITSIREAILKCGLKDGMTISFHHHLRSGDYVLNMVMEEIAKLGIKNLTINASSIHDGHAPLVEHIKNGVVISIETPYIGSRVGRCISEGYLKNPVTFVSHGGRPSRIARGISHIDVAFIAAPTADEMGNATGKIGKSACGALGYAFVDAEYADKTVIITDNLVPYPLYERSISEEYVDYVVKVDSIGDPKGIVSGTTSMPKDPVALIIAKYTADAIHASGFLKDGMSFQTGAGGPALATAGFLKEIMIKEGIRGSYALGGITGYMVEMLEAGCFQAIQDVQCFDLKAVESLRKDPRHFEITASQYSSPTAKSSAASSLDVVVLGATEIDTSFNVNVHTDSNGYIMGGSGGHTDVAEEAKLVIVAAPLSRARISTVVDRVLCISTPGTSIDMLVTQYGIAVNPSRLELKEKLQKAGLPVKEIEELKMMAEHLNGIGNPVKQNRSRIVGRVLNRAEGELDVIYAVNK
jgi:citrate lyase subunit alpha/citrate CoA-transferase